MNWDKSKEKHWSFQDCQVAASRARRRAERRPEPTLLRPLGFDISLRSLARINDQATRPTSSTLNSTDTGKWVDTRDLRRCAAQPISPRGCPRGAPSAAAPLFHRQPSAGAMAQTPRAILALIPANAP